MQSSQPLVGPGVGKKTRANLSNVQPKERTGIKKPHPQGSIRDR